MLETEAAPWEMRTAYESGSCGGKFFAPTCMGTLEDGSNVIRPDLSTFGPQSLNVWRARVQQFTHPLMMARYADVVWEFGPVIDSASKRDFRAAQIAIDAYLQVHGEQLEDDVRAAWYLRRALVLATEINDRLRTEQVAEALLNSAVSAKSDHIGIWIAPAKAFKGNRMISTVSRERLRVLLEQKLNDAVASANGFAAHTACDALLDIYPKGTQREERTRVLRSYSQAVILQSKAAFACLAIDWLAVAAQSLEKEGLTSDAEQLRLLMENRGPEAVASMKPYSVEVPIDRDALNKSLDELANVQHPMIALVRLTQQLLPKRDNLRERVLAHTEEFPIVSIIPRSIRGRDGLPKASIGPSLSDMDGRIVEQATQDLGLTAYFFKLGYDKTKERFGFTAHDLGGFASCSSLVRSDSRDIVEQGLHAYDDADYAKTISLLVPEIERMLRELLSLLGVPKSKSVRGQSELKNMNDVLRAQCVIDSLDENLLLFLSVLFIDKRSYNLRNELAHGMLSTSAYNWSTASLVVMSVFLLAIIGPHGVFLAPNEP